MNVNRLINMGLRMLMRRGVGTAMKSAGRKRQGQTGRTDQNQASGFDARDAGRKAQRALRLMRRFMR